MSFELSAQLSGHDDDVRAVCFPDSDAVVTASRDKTVRIWKKTATTPPTFDATIITKGADFINTLAYVPPSSDHTEGLIVFGSKDTTIEVRDPTSTLKNDANRVLIGHSHNVCALDVSPKGTYLVSGSWDSSAIIWGIGKWDPEIRLDGHGGSVWGVVALDEETAVTGCADAKLRIYDLTTASGGVAQPKSIIHTTDVVRAVCAIPKGHPSGADIASAHNDGVIRFWRLSGESLGELHGHESFVYSLTHLPTGELVSAGEDRTVRIWKGTECVQTITHPAISVWSVAANQQSGDIVTGASDGIARVFTRSKERVASPDTLAQFEESVKSSSIPQQQVEGGVNMEKLPGPDFLTSRSGTKDGQVQMIREHSGSITAHTWSQSQQQWINVGTVVDAVGSSGKKVDYKGRSYDFVFDVDIEDGAPPLKLPFNLSQNPYEAARKFLGDNELPLTYLENVANFITDNTRGATLGQASGSSTTEFGVGKYQPGAEEAPQPAMSHKIVPQREYLTVATFNAEPVLRKLISINATMVSSGRKDNALNPHEESILRDLTERLGKFSTSIPATISGTNKEPPTLGASEGSVNLIRKLVTQWAYADRLPVLDLLRLMVADATVVATEVSSSTPVELALKSAFDVPEGTAINENAVTMAFRAVANAFATPQGRSVAKEIVDDVLSYMQTAVGIKSKWPPVTNRNALLAISTVAINYAVLGVADARLQLCHCMVKLLEKPQHDDPEVQYRALIALGTIATISPANDPVKQLDLQAPIQAVLHSRGAEQKVKDVARECLTLLT